MLLSSLKLSVSNPGFTFGYESLLFSNWEKAGLVFFDLLFFLIHPIALKIRISALNKQQEAIKASRNVTLSEKFERNMQTIIRKENEYYAFKRLELGFETLFQITLRWVSSTHLGSIFNFCSSWVNIILKSCWTIYETITSKYFDLHRVGSKETYKMDIGPHL